MARALLVTLWIGITSLLLPCEALPSYRQDSEECTTPACQEAARFLLDSMDTSADPCQDFYQYACGGWVAKHPIPEEKSSYSTFYVLHDQLQDTVASLLKHASTENHARSVLDAADLFLGCINEDAREAQGLDPIKAVLNSIGGWPMANPRWSDSGYQWQKEVATVIRTLSVGPIISAMVEEDANRTSQHVITVDQPQFGLGRNQLIDLTSSERNKEIVAAYRNYIIATAKLLNPNVDETQVARDADELIQFESSIARFSKPMEERRDASSWYHKMTVAEMKAQTENTYFEWTDFLNEILKDFPLVTDETEIILSEKDYIKNTIKLAHQTNSRILANYIGWILLKSFGQHTTKQFRENEFQFQKVEMGIQKQELLQRICTQKTIELLGFAVGRLYVDRFFTEEGKRDADQLVEDIRTAYASTLRQNTWMDTGTTNEALEKLNAMMSKMGYPPWIKDDAKLSKYYSGVQRVQRDKYFSSLRQVYEAITAITLKKWNQPTDRANDWVTEPPVVNAFYSPGSNSITFPAGILNLPFYKYGRSPALNFGGIGCVIGHEVSHGFDDQGSQHDKEGNLVNWWSDETKEKFNRKADCFRNQYSSYVEPTTNMSLNGNNTVGENIADNGAVRNAFIAYKMHQRKSGNQNKRLPGVSATPDQLFFLGFSTMWCGTERKEFLEWSIQYAFHTPNEYRAFVPLTNSKDFADAFSCPLGSAMNPVSKCVLW